MATYVEKLNAYVDGELDDASTREVVRQMETDDATRSLVDDLHAVDALAEQAYAEVLTQPVPSRLRDVVYPAKRKAWLASGAWQIRVAAAVAVLAVGLSAGYFAARHNSSRTIADLEQRNSQLAKALSAATAQALEYQPSGHSLSENGGASGWRVTVTPLQTFRTASNQYCRRVRQVIVRDGSPEQITGIWCRVDKDRWQVRATEPAPEKRTF